MVVIQALEPFHLSATPHSFVWTPFLGFMQGSIEVNIRSFFEKVFSYGALVWLTTRTGCNFMLAVGLTGGLVLCLRLGQVFLPERSTEITDIMMLLMLPVMGMRRGEISERDATPVQA
jgi:hypothetical protein